MAGRARATRRATPSGWLSSSVRWPTGPPAAVVGEWVPRLLPGTVGAATHGLIRTGHAVRGARARPTRRPGGSRWRHGLAFWASSYEELPGPPLLIGQRGRGRGAGRPALPSRGRAAPRSSSATGGRRGRHRRRVRTGRGVARVEPASAVELLDELAVGRRAGLPAQRRRAVGPSACCTPSPRRWRASCCCPGWPKRTATPRSGYAWQAAAALHVAYDVDRSTPVPERSRRVDRGARRPRRWPPATSTPSSSTEAALRAFERSGDPALLVGGGRRLPPASELSRDAGRRQAPGAAPGSWVASARWSTAHSAGPASRSAPSAWGR